MVPLKTNFILFIYHIKYQTDIQKKKKGTKVDLYSSFHLIDLRFYVQIRQVKLIFKFQESELKAQPEK